MAPVILATNRLTKNGCRCNRIYLQSFDLLGPHLPLMLAHRRGAYYLSTKHKNEDSFY
jgi:hypothetical protein